MNPRALAAALAFAFGFAASVALAQSGASGKVSIDGKSWPVADAVAVSDQGSVEMWFTELKFDRMKWAEDGQFGVFDPYSFVDDGSGTSVTVNVDEDGSYGGHSVRLGSSSSSSTMSSEHEDTLVLSVNDGKRVAGTWKLDDGSGLVVDVKFDLPLTPTGPMARPGTPLAAGGGEPGKALQAMVDATHAGKLDRMIALSDPERRKGIEDAIAAGEGDEMLRMVQLFTPKISRITGGTVLDDRAWVDFEGSESGGTVKGTAELSRKQDTWFVKSINTRSGG